MRKFLLILCCITLFSALDAQVLYTTTYGGGTNGKGTISRFMPATNDFSNIFSFDYPDVTYPLYSTMIQSGNGKLYGIGRCGVDGDAGVIFSFIPSTASYTILKYIDDLEGADPHGSLVQGADGKFYGMASIGGNNNYGTIFSFDATTNTFTKLKDFDGINGAYPEGSLVQATNGKLYGMTYSGGTKNNGVIFSFDPHTSVFTKLLDFNYLTTGASPHGNLIQAADGKLYGMTANGGSSGAGTIFSYNPADANYRIVKNFNGTNGGTPYGSLLQASDGKLYGMTYSGGGKNNGVIFSFSPSTSAYTKLKDLDEITGSTPYGNLMQAVDGKLYGMTIGGGTYGNGVIFSIIPSTNTYTKLMDFNEIEGRRPYGSLIQASDGKFYGMTFQGGISTTGVIFSFNAANLTYTKLKDFGPNTSGSDIIGGIISGADGKFYGMTYNGGNYGYGVIFSFDSSTSSYTKLMDFNGINGRFPKGSLVQASNGKLYGMTFQGGSDDYGLLFSFDPATSSYTLLKDYDYTDGGYPAGSLLQASDGKLYGMTTNGGKYGEGTIFSFDPAASIYTKLMEFDHTNGSIPYGNLIQASDGKLYGMATMGGAGNMGDIFSFDPVTLTFTKLLDFDYFTNGAYPFGSLIQAFNGKLYGMTSEGNGNFGTIFSFDPHTSTYTALKNFDSLDGSKPYGSLLQASNGRLYGMTNKGGSHGVGVAFSFDPDAATYTKLVDFDETGGKDPMYTAFIEPGCASNIIYYRDVDGDGYGDANASTTNCKAPDGYVTDKTDCNDADRTIYTGAPELCDGKDNNCDGVIDEGCAVIKINNVSKTEGNSGQTNMTLNVSLSKASVQTITVNYKTVSKAAKATSDYIVQTGTLTFKPGIKKQTISILINGDNQVESDEKFKVVLGNPVNAGLIDSIGLATILNDDFAARTMNTAENSINQSLTVSPNPSNGVFLVQVKGYTGIVTLQLMDMQGKSLREAKLQTSNMEYVRQKFDATDIVSGTYIVTATDEKGNKQYRKVLIVH